jgi:hypothetical protein
MCLLLDSRCRLLAPELITDLLITDYFYADRPATA